GDEALSCATTPRVDLVIHVQLAGNEQEIVTDPMEQDRQENEAGTRARIVHAARQQEIAHYPRKDAEKDGLLVTELFQHDWQEEQENHIRHLGQRHFGGGVSPAEFSDVHIHVHEVEIEWNADE